MTSCYKNVLQVRRKAVETGCVNIFWLSLFVFVCYSVQPQTEDFETLLFFPTAWLAHFAHVEICSIIHPADIDAPKERAGVGEEMCE